MGKFLAEYWIWIVTPIVLVLVPVVALLVLGSGGGESPFVYNIFD